MNSAERQQAIANVLIHRRQETVANLMNEFGVSRSTVLRDITALTCSLPIETARGRYGGGVKLAEEYRPYRTTLSPEQAAAIRRAEELAGTGLSGKERQALHSVLTQFASPV